MFAARVLLLCLVSFAAAVNEAEAGVQGSQVLAVTGRKLLCGGWKCPPCCGHCDWNTCKCHAIKHDWYKRGYWLKKDGECACRDWEGYTLRHGHCVKEAEYKCPDCCEWCNHKERRCDRAKKGWWIHKGHCFCKKWEGYDYKDGECVKKDDTPFHCPSCCGGCNHAARKCDWWKEGSYLTKDGSCACKDWDGYSLVAGKCVKLLHPLRLTSVSHGKKAVATAGCSSPPCTAYTSTSEDGGTAHASAVAFGKK